MFVSLTQYVMYSEKSELKFPRTTVKLNNTIKYVHQAIENNFLPSNI